MLERMSRLIKADGSTKARELIAKADALRDGRAWKEAAEAYRAALEADAGMAGIWVQYGHTLKESGQHAEAENAYQRSLALTDDADTHLQLGHLHKIMGQRRRAEEDYLHALERQPDLADARSELGRLGWSGARLRAFLAKGGKNSASEAETSAVIAFELSDLIDHLQRSRYPTGIQRVQLALGAALAESFDEEQVQFVYYDHLLSDFFEVQRRQVVDLYELVNDVEADHDIQRTMIDAFKGSLNKTRPFEFPEAAYLVNVGTSWGFINYFLSIREAKRRNRVRYVPLVHDCIPLIYPEFCNPNLVRDFINWISHMLGHADLILTNSDNTKADVVKVARQIDISPPSLTTMRLNGEYGSRSDLTEVDRASQDVLRAHNLDIEDFVLLVSTIEPRKNHMLALNAWSRLLKSRPRSKVPRLVFVGSSGWMNEPIYQRLERDAALSEHVVILQNVSEQVLQLLYARCLFTLFPSLYEGWGLPISEALAHGKVPLVSNVSSHPEAGGDLAVLFDLDSEADFQAKLENLIDDAKGRAAREEKIKKAKPLRPWSDIARELYGSVETHLKEHPAKPATTPKVDAPPALISGRYYSLARNLASDLQSLVHSGDLYRAGLNWHGPETFGCWIRGLSADIAFTVGKEEGEEFLLYLQLLGAPSTDNTVTLALPPSNWSRRVTIRQGEAYWNIIPLRFSPDSKREVRLRIASEKLIDFASLTEGRDVRVSSLGVMGLYLCRSTDGLQRSAITEAIQFGSMDAIARKTPDCALL